MAARPEHDARRETAEERLSEGMRLDSASIQRDAPPAASHTVQPPQPAPQQDLSSSGLSFPSTGISEDAEHDLERERASLAASLSRARAPESPGAKPRRTLFFRRAHMKPARRTGGNTVIDRIISFLARALKALEQKLTRKPEAEPPAAQKAMSEKAEIEEKEKNPKKRFGRVKFRL